MPPLAVPLVTYFLLNRRLSLVLLSLFVTLGLSDIILPQPVSLLETTL